MTQKMAETPNIITFSGESQFADALAHFLLHEYDHKEILHHVRLILPNNAAISAVKDALFQASGKQALLLPHISTISDIAAEQWLSAEALGAVNISPVIDARRRLLWVSEYVQQLMPDISMRSSLYYAESFLSLRDDAQRALKDSADFDGLVDEPYALHWQEALAMFKKVMATLDAALLEGGLSEPIAYNNHIKQIIAEHIDEVGLNSPVIVAGSTASVPSSARFMQSIAMQEKGLVILPSLDTQLPKFYWDMITGDTPLYTHPQYHMKRFMDQCGISRDEVRQVTFSQLDSSIISKTMYPQEAAELLLQEPVKPEQVRHIELYETDDDSAEMELCALLIMDAIHHGVSNIAVITELRDAIDRLQTLLARRGIEIDRFAAQPLSHGSEYQFMMLCALLLFDSYNSVTFLSLLRHPLCFPEWRAETLEMAEYCDAGLLRGLHGLRSVAEVCDAYMEITSSKSMVAQQLKDIFIVETQDKPCEGLFQLHKSCIKRLLQSSQNSTLSMMLKELSIFTPLMHEKRACSANDYCELVEHYFAQHTAYDKHVSHSPVRVLGAIEARMVRADVIIIPHMNEGHWPRHMSAEPWLNHAMRRAAGLNFAERQIGLAAHDISNAMKAPRFIAMRARKETNTPMQASRFFERLKLICQPDGQRLSDQQAQWQHYLHEWRKHNASTHKARDVAKPAPTPPLALRRTRLSATQCETLMQNPFILYVSHILKLSDREPYDEPFSPKHFGTAAHEAMQLAATTYAPQHFERYQHELTRQFEEYLQEKIEPELRHFYVKKLARILETILQEETARAQSVQKLMAEYKLQKELMIDDTSVTFTMRADRIEELRDAWRIVDYKTGTPPNQTQIASGLACQLLIAGWIARDAHTISDLEYWELKGNEHFVQGVNGKKINLEDEQFWQQVQTGLTNLARYYCCTADAAFAWIEGEEGYADGAAHIARVGEW